VLVSPVSVVDNRGDRARAHQDESAHGECCCDLSWSCWRSKELEEMFFR
jgi:hypothetical protein